MLCCYRKQERKEFDNWIMDVLKKINFNGELGTDDKCHWDE